MSNLSNPEYLKGQQYKDSANLNARVSLHDRFSTNPYGWFRWVFDHYDLPPDCRILELGCGSAEIWRHNSHRIPKGWQITLSDFSEGMLEQARQTLAGEEAFSFQVIDAQSIPFDDKAFDGVIANHMLYHVPDRPKALREIRRVLRQDGTLFASTVWEKHMEELLQLPFLYDPRGKIEQMKMANEFTLENGKAQLEVFFDTVELRRYPDSLRVTEPEPLIAYLLSTARLASLEQREEFAAFVRKTWEESGGVLEITKDSGLFIAR